MNNDLPFINENLFSFGPWQAMERAVGRLMQHGNYEDVKLVGRSGDGGADILGNLNGKRWIVQVKFRSSGSLTVDAVDEVIHAMKLYRADIPVIATNCLVNQDILNKRNSLLSSGVLLQIWEKPKIIREFNRLTEISTKLGISRPYQEKPIRDIVESTKMNVENKGLVIMATGLGKTFVAAESVRRIFTENKKIKKILILAHTNELVYQLERSFWPSLNKHNTTAIWNGNEKGPIQEANITFACIDSIVNEINKEGCLPVNYDMVIIDEAHHAASNTYKKLLDNLKAGLTNGPFLLGLTATPWRSDEQDLKQIFGKQICCIDMVYGMENGYLSNVDYRMHVDNIDWQMLSEVKDLTPRALNKTLFIKEWDDAVIDVIQKTWNEITNPRAIVFCSTIEHAFTVRNKINARQFTRAGIIYSGSYLGKVMNPVDRNVTMFDFADGKLGIICAVDIFNEGIDVPDVNILVFQRVTHSRRIFVQQLGRGLRITEDKNKVIVLDFVSDIRRFAAGLEIKNQLSRAPRYIQLNNPVKFVNKTGEDHRAENFLKVWLDDVATIQDAGEDDHVLKFPPDLAKFNENTG